MASAVGKYAAQKMLKKQMKGYQDKKVDGGEVRRATESNHQPPN